MIRINCVDETTNSNEQLNFLSKLVQEFAKEYNVPIHVKHEFVMKVCSLEIAVDEFCEWLKVDKKLIARPFNFEQYGFGYVFEENEHLTFEMIRLS